MNLLLVDSSREEISQIPDIAHRLIAGDGVPDMISATSQLLRLVLGECASAARVRDAVAHYAGILRSLVKLIKLCQPPHHVHKPMVFKTLSQLVFYNQSNSDLLAGDTTMLAQIILAVYGGIDLLQMETARLVNNLTASSVHAAGKLCSYPGMLEAIKQLCSSTHFLIRFRAVSTVNCLTRHALSHPKLSAALAQSAIVDDLMKLEPCQGGSPEQHHLYGFLRTCVVGNAMSSIERRTWEAEEGSLVTAVRIITDACAGTKFAGVSCQIHPVLLSLRYLAVSEANKKTLVENGLCEELADFIEKWEEDASQELGVQLECLELAMTLLLTLISVDGKLVIKVKLYETEVKNRLRALNFGSSLFKTIKFRPSHTAVDLAQRLIKELQLRPDQNTQMHLGPYPDHSPSRMTQDSLCSSSSRMLGISRAVPRSSHPDWAQPLTAGAGGQQPSIPRPHTTHADYENSLECEFVFDEWGGEGHHPNDLLWNFPSILHMYCNHIACMYSFIYSVHSISYYMHTFSRSPPQRPFVEFSQQTRRHVALV